MGPSRACSSTPRATSPGLRSFRTDSAAFRLSQHSTRARTAAHSRSSLDTPYDKPIRRVAIVGTGVIGASWAALYLARGFDVVATDPAPNAEANLRKYVDEAW